jgi:hypothetical protein
MEASSSSVNPNCSSSSLQEISQYIVTVCAYAQNRSEYGGGSTLLEQYASFNKTHRMALQEYEHACTTLRGDAVPSCSADGTLPVMAHPAEKNKARLDELRSAHLRDSLVRVCKLALVVLEAIHSESLAHSQGRGDPWLDRSTNADSYYAATQVLILSHVLLPAGPQRKELQSVLVDQCSILTALHNYLLLDRETELKLYAEGYRTELVALLAHLLSENRSACHQVAETPGLMKMILEATKIDEDNPGMGEWAQFAIRNLCDVPAGRQQISTLGKEATALDPQTADSLRSCGVQATLNDQGRLVMEVVPPASQQASSSQSCDGSRPQ